MSDFPRTYPTVDQALRTYREMRAHGLSEHVVPPISSGHVLADEVERLREIVRAGSVPIALLPDDAIVQHMLAELQRFREREPLVQRWLELGDQGRHYFDDCDGCEEELAALRAVRDFKLTPSVKCPSQADGQADDLTPAAPADAAESQGKSGSDAG